MIAEPLVRVLEATGYLSSGQPAADSVAVGESQRHEWAPSFLPDAWWRSSAETGLWRGDVDLKVYFKFVEEPANEPIDKWQKELWNRGFSPLLWVVSPERIDLYNGFGEPKKSAEANRLDTFSLLDTQLAKLDRYAGRLAMETGQFWRTEPKVNREQTVEARLLRHLAALERNLVDAGLPRNDAQGLIGRSIFVQYLIDREIVPAERLHELTGRTSLPEVLDNHEAAERLFGWLRERFNGDMFPLSEVLVPDTEHIQAVAEFLRGTDPENGQTFLFPYQFEVIPVDLISAIYEQFVHAAEKSASDSDSQKKSDAHYTPITAVSLVLDEVFEDLTGYESVLDLTCGSGIFLVEAMRRLVCLRSEGQQPRRETVRSVLHNQIHGLDIMPEAVRVAAFSLYLTALELDPSPSDLRFEPLIGTALLEGNAFDDHFEGEHFDVIVGNPPWSFRGKAATAARRGRNPGAPRSPRGESLDFALRALDFAHSSTRVGMILCATPFFSRSKTGLNAAQSVVEALAPVTLVNLSELSQWLFPKVNMPAIALLACRRGPRPDGMTLVHSRWSQTGERSHMIEVAPGDVSTLPIPSWKRNVGLFKASFLGRRNDLLLLDDLQDRHETLDVRLKALGAELSSGVTLGTDRRRDASFLKKLKWVRSGIRHFDIPEALPAFSHAYVERPRERSSFAAPLLVVGGALQEGNPRPVVAVAERDLAYSNVYFGASFAKAPVEAAYLIAGIFGSALASWFFLVTGSTFGIWFRRLTKADLSALPVPDIEHAIKSDTGMRVVSLARRMHGKEPSGEDWNVLDGAVFDLYSLDKEERAVVRDGLFRASWQWKAGRLASVEPAELDDLREYAETFLGAMDTWLSGAGRRRMRAEVIELPSRVPLRVVRFILENAPGPSEQVEVVHPVGDLFAVLSKIGERAKVQLSSALVGIRDLRVNAHDEVSIIKPSARRNWLSVQALEDAHAVVKDSLHGINRDR